MSSLHLINKASLQNDTLASLSADDTLLLIEDGVYLSHNLPEQISNPVYALKNDAEARGIMFFNCPKDFFISDKQFVELVCSHKNTVSW